LHPAFQIQSSGFRLVDLSRSDLLIDVGPAHFCYTIMIHDTREFVALEYFSLKERRTEDAIKEILANPLFRKQYQQTYLFYNTTDTTLIPGSHFHNSVTEAAMHLIHGDLSDDLILSESVPEWDIHNLYRVPKAWHGELYRMFPEGSYWHYHSAWLRARKNCRDLPEGDSLHILFYPDKAVVVLFKRQMLQLLQSCAYETPEDISFYLLRIAEQFRLSPENLNLYVSGMLDTSSAVYTELIKYFSSVELESRSRKFYYDFAFDNYPQHYFVPIFSCALCES
jgi:hypothetical protein